jgi:hypothetical protein
MHCKATATQAAQVQQRRVKTGIKVGSRNQPSHICTIDSEPGRTDDLMGERNGAGAAGDPHKKVTKELGVVVHACNPTSRDAETDRLGVCRRAWAASQNCS